MSGASRRRYAPPTPVAALLVAALLAAGCGSGGDDPPGSDGASRDEGAASPGADRAPVGEPEKRPTTTAQGGASGRTGGDEQDDPARRKGTSKRAPSSAKLAERQAKACIARFGRAVCAKMVRRAGVPATRFERPEDCLKAMSRARCEQLAAAQREAGERTRSVNVEECIDHPTPRCEAILRPVLEAQRGR